MNLYILKSYLNPLEKIIFTKSTKASVAKYTTLNKAVESYNNSIEKTNKKISEIKKKIDAANIVSITNELNTLIDTESRHSKDVNILCVKYLAERAMKVKLDSEKIKAKSELDKYTEEVFKKHEANINLHLKNFGAGFEVISLKTSYVGGKPSSQYGLKINDTQIELGDASTVGKPSFRTALSNGDKNALAFAFFLSRLEHDQNLKDKIIIFDHPMNSLDRHRRSYTIQQIIKIAGIAKQMVLMSHDVFFLRDVFNEFSDKAKIKNLCVTKSAASNLIEEWDLIQASQSLYIEDISKLNDY